MGEKKERMPEGVRKLPGGRYQARYPVVVSGRTVQRSAGTFASKRDAATARGLALAKYQAGEDRVDPSAKRLTVEQWSAQWLELGQGNTKTRSFLNARILPRWGQVRMATITTMDVQAWVLDLEREGLAPLTVQSLHATFKRILEAAVRYDRLSKNPCVDIRLPKKKRTERQPLTLADLLALEDAAPSRYKAMVHLGAWAGLRWQECAALMWDAIDLEAGVVHVRRAVKVDGTIGTTKNGRDRFVPLAPRTIEALRVHRRDHGWTDLLFPSENTARPIRANNFRRRVWAPTLEDAGLEGRGVTFHKLRHAFAGHMYAAGLDLQVISSHLGHHAPSFTADTYGWRRPDHAAVTVEAIERAMQS